MKIRSYNGGSLYSEVILKDLYSAWFSGRRSLLGGWLLFGGLLFGAFTVVIENNLYLLECAQALGVIHV